MLLARYLLTGASTKDHRGHSSEKGDSSSWRRASGRSSGGAPEGGVLSQEGTL